MGRSPEFPGCRLHSSFAPVTWVHTAGSFFTRVTASLGIFGRFSSAWIAFLPRSTKLHIFTLPNTSLSYSSTARLYQIRLNGVVYYFNFCVAFRRTVPLTVWTMISPKSIYIYIYIYIYTHNTKETRYTRFVQKRTFSVFLAVACENCNEPQDF